MKTVRMTKESTSAPRLQVVDIPTPRAGHGELLIKIKACAIQPSDIINSKGCSTATTFPRILGRDFAGIVVEGPQHWMNSEIFGTSGDTFSVTEDGALAEYAVLTETAVVKTISFAQAAALGIPWSTARLTLSRAQTVSDDVVMVLGATGSIGSTVKQIAQAFGCRTIGVGRHGTDINSTTDPELHGAKDLTNGKGPDVVVDTVGDLALTQAAIKSMNFNGRISIISAPRQGSTEMQVDALALYRSQISIVGCNSAAQPQDAMARIQADLVPAIESEKLEAPDEKGWTLLQIDDALDAFLIHNHIILHELLLLPDRDVTSTRFIIPSPLPRAEEFHSTLW